MKTSLYIISLISIILLFSTCKKEGPQGPPGPTGAQGATGQNGIGSADPRLYTTWEVTSGLQHTKYIIIKNDNSYYYLDSLEHGFKSIQSGLAMITGTQFMIMGWFRYNYAITNNTLVLSSPSQTITLKKTARAVDEFQWVTHINITDSIGCPASMIISDQDIGFDGTNILLMSYDNPSTVYKFNPQTHAVTTTNLPFNSYYGSSIHYSHPNLWITNGSTIDRVNSYTGTLLSTSPSLSQHSISALALVGNYMWFADNRGNVALWNVISNTVQTPIFRISLTNGMEYVNNYLYILSGDYIHKIDPNTFQATQTYFIEHDPLLLVSSGLTFDGSKFWVLGYDATGDSYKLLKLSI